jgi:hypothetical protein
LNLTPSTLNLRSQGNGPGILAHLAFPKQISGPQPQLNGPPVLYPGGAQAAGFWKQLSKGKPLAILASFDKNALAGQVSNGRNELTVAGQLTNGQWYYGRDTIQILGTTKNR